MGDDELYDVVFNSGDWDSLVKRSNAFLGGVDVVEDYNPLAEFEDTFEILTVMLDSGVIEDLFPNLAAKLEEQLNLYRVRYGENKKSH